MQEKDEYFGEQDEDTEIQNLPLYTERKADGIYRYRRRVPKNLVERVGKGYLGRFIRIQPNEHRQLKSKAAEREVPLHTKLERLLDTSLPKQGRLFPTLSVDKVVKAYAKLRIAHPNLTGTVFHSTRKWFITQCERTGVPEHYTATLVGHHSARSSNKLTYALYSGGISDAQKREIVDGIRLPDSSSNGEGTS